MLEKEIKTTCSYCGVGCGIIAKKDHQGKLRVKGDPDHPVNRGMLCSKGMNLHYVANDISDRLLYPEMRWSRSHPRVRVSWEQAMQRASGVFRSLIQKYGSDSVGLYVSGQCLTEEYYIANKLTKGYLGTNNIDTNSRLCMSSAVVGYKKTFGEDSVPIAYADIELADCFLITGANPSWCHPILFRRIEQHKEKNPDVKIVVIDPRKTDTANFADLHLQLIPGTDIVLYNAIGRRLMEKGFADKEFIKNNTEGYTKYREQLLSMSYKEASRICGIPKEAIFKAAEYIGKAKGFISMWAMGLNQSVVGTDKNFALLNLSLLTGQVGKPGSGPFSLTGQPNAMGGREVGGMANLLAVHKDLLNPDHREEVARFWGVESISPRPGYTATEMFDALENGDLKAVWIICTNPMVSLPNSNRIQKALKNARFVIVQDISNRSDTLEYADLVLPAAAWMEKEGTMTNSERRISYLPKGINPPGEARPDVEILCDFAKHMGYRGFDYQFTEDIYREYCSMTKGTNIDISHLSYDRLKNEGSLQWPVPSYRHTGTPRLFEDKQFYTPSKKAIFNVPYSVKNASVSTDQHFPLILTTGRVRDQWHTMTKTGKVARLNSHYPKPVVEINPVDAHLSKCRDGDVVVVSSRNGVVRVKAKVTENMRPGVVFLPMHWGKQLQSTLNRANNLTNTIIDPQSKEPDFKYTAVQVRKYEKPKENILVVGAGAAAFRFVQNYRDMNDIDTICVFSREANPFYNRVLLPEYITEELTWEQLLKIKERELRKLEISLYPETFITAIDREQKIATDNHGKPHRYDKLIMATGSSAFIPRDAQLKLPGRFTMRTKTDADNFKEYLENTGLPPEQQHVVIVGGGLLGLELAAALKHNNLKVTIVQRSSRLMERQLDPTSSRLLALDVQERGISIYFDNEVSTVFNDEESGQLEITLRSGKVLEAHAIVYAIGTRPNIGLARESGLVCSRGVKVNEFMQTSDPDIFAIGEIAEFRDQLFGITAAAEQQANILASYLAGDISEKYEGSVLMNILKFNDLNLCSIGNIHYQENDPEIEEIIFTDISKRYYKKCIVKNDMLIGAILMGDKNEFAEYKALIESGTELADKREKLLRGSGGGGKPVKGKLICSCSQVGKGNLIEMISAGQSDFTGLCNESGAGLGCGSCKTEVRSILEEQKALIS
ncbi:nitrate reductase [Robertkochia solimangrovi]|uniref:nitrate reductase n=1 Tax=Robertkochia solimangrovi TaxID=2213046 RepID=UPI00117DAAF1|nr:nitrate reductase [Robertkochia solimangrovi]TRZ42287.1 NAD(P)H-nitrite reductase [Robertkochia solimangrovi]